MQREWEQKRWKTNFYFLFFIYILKKGHEEGEKEKKKLLIERNGF